MSVQIRTFADRLEVTTRKAQRLGSFPCPRCGRFARVIEKSQDHNGEWWFRVDCKKCGEGANG